MPDISMCPDDECPVRRSCRRNPASGTTPTPLMQSWMGFHHDGPQGCAEFWAKPGLETADAR